MPRVDYYVRTLGKFNADAIVLQSNAQVVVRLPDGDRAASQAVAHADLVALVREVLPPEMAASFGPNQTLRFPYSAEGRTVGVVVEAGAQALRATVFADLAQAGIEGAAVPGAGGASAAALGAAGGAGAMATGGGEELAIERTSYADERAEAVRRGFAASTSTFAGMVAAACEAGATDLFLSAGEPPMVRAGGQLCLLAENRLTDMDVRLLIEDAMEARALDALDESGDAVVGRVIDGTARVRISASRGRGGHTAAVHLAPIAAERVVLPPPVAELANQASGLVLVAGMAGAGRTAILSALAEAAAARPGLAILIGEPLEVELDPARALTLRRDVPADTPSAEAGLRAALRIGPALVVAGDLRTEASLRAALELTEAGSLVLAVVDAPTPQVAAARLACALGGDAVAALARLDASVRGIVYRVGETGAELEVAAPPLVLRPA